MTLIIAFIVAHLGVIGGALAAAVALIGVWFHGKSTGTKQATADAADKVATANATAGIAKQQAAGAQADAAQAQDETKAVKAAADAQQSAGAMTSDQLDAEAAKLGILRKD